MVDLYRCQSCGGTQFVTDTARKTINCVDCDWDKVIGTDDYGRFTRCIDTTQNGKRCSNNADVYGYCWHHGQDRPDVWKRLFGAWQQHHEGDVPAIYRQVFINALIDARRAHTDTSGFERLRTAAPALADKYAARREQSVVYFVRREDLIKIGTTTNIDKRVKAISKGSSMPPGMTVGPVELLATTPGNADLESRLHAQFAEQRIPRTEWFHPCPELWGVIHQYQHEDAPHPLAA